MPTAVSVSVLETYLRESGKSAAELSSGFLAYLANLDNVAQVAPEIARSIVAELASQRSTIKLIASENYSSMATQSAMANLLTDKYAEGFPFKRFYAGCENVDAIEAYACAKALELFGAEHAYVQPHSGADANLVAFWAVLTQRIELPEVEKLGLKDSADLNAEQWEAVRQKLGNQRLLGMDLRSGGHLTHGFRKNSSAKMFQAFSYSVSKETSLIDYAELERQTMEVKPLILLAGFSAYPRSINFATMRAIADKAGAVLMVDMAHFAGLVAGKVLTGDFDPIAHAHIVTTTTHKTLRGPRGGLVLSTAEFKDQVDKGCPFVLGGPLPHVLAAKAVAFTEAARPEFRTYAAKIVENSRALAEGFVKRGGKVISGGTDNHLVLVDVTPYGLTGRQAESVLRECNVTLNRNAIPFDPNGAWYTSGLRLGTPAATTLGMGVAEMDEIAGLITRVLSGTKPESSDKGPSKAKYTLDAAAKDEGVARVRALMDRYPVYPELDLGFLERHFAS